MRPILPPHPRARAAALSSWAPHTALATGSIVDGTNAVVTVVSGAAGFGTHCSIWLEFWKAGAVFMLRSLELGAAASKDSNSSTAVGDQSLSVDEKVHQTYDAATGVETWLPGCAQAALPRSHYKSYRVPTASAVLILKAAHQFQRDILDGKYYYLLSGGVTGRVIPGKRGVNCADFAILVLRAAGIQVQKGLGVYNTPYAVAR